MSLCSASRHALLFVPYRLEADLFCLECSVAGMRCRYVPQLTAAWTCTHYCCCFDLLPAESEDDLVAELRGFWSDDDWSKPNKKRDRYMQLGQAAADRVILWCHARCLSPTAVCSPAAATLNSGLQQQAGLGALGHFQVSQSPIGCHACRHQMSLVKQ